MKNSTVKQSTLGAFIIIGITLVYILQMSPAPVLLSIGEHYDILNNNALLNMPVNIMYPFIILGCFLGNTVENKIGKYWMFVVVLLLNAVGSLTNIFSGSSYEILLVGRSIFGLGFGLGVPFIGNAIMAWFKPENREKMNTCNGFFPFVGTLIAFALIAPIAVAIGWRWSLSIWGILLLAVAAVWVLTVKKSRLPCFAEEEVAETQEKNIYRNLWERKEIKILTFAFLLDFSCYSFLAIILPSFLYEASGFSENISGLLAAIVFPGIGFIGALTCGVFMARTGSRKMPIVIGQVLSFCGFMILTLGATTSVTYILIGVAIYGFGNGFWLPPMYCIPTELENMTPNHVGAAFGLLTAIGFIFGFLSPVVGGLLTDYLMTISNITDPVSNHVFGLRWTMFIFSFVYVLNFFIALRLRETGSSEYRASELKVI